MAAELQTASGMDLARAREIIRRGTHSIAALIKKVEMTVKTQIQSV